MSPLLAIKGARDEGIGLAIQTTTALTQLRVIHDFTTHWDAGVTGSAIGATEGGTRYGLGGEVGRRVMQNMRFAAGYNLFGFRDGDLRETDYTLQGAFVRLDFKFDEQSLKLRPR